MYKTVALLAQEFSNQRGTLGPLGEASPWIEWKFFPTSCKILMLLTGQRWVLMSVGIPGITLLLPVFPGRVLSLTSLGPHGHLGW